jgi:phosphomannomutase
VEWRTAIAGTDDPKDERETVSRQMPEISRFYGIIIGMFYGDHNPPHFHARYGRERVAIEIRSLRVLEGGLPPRALGLVMEWASRNQAKLMDAWVLAKNDKPPKKIAPLT